MIHTIQMKCLCEALRKETLVGGGQFAKLQVRIWDTLWAMIYYNKYRKRWEIIYIMTWLNRRCGRQENLMKK
jgi:hypothetical protein